MTQTFTVEDQLKDALERITAKDKSLELLSSTIDKQWKEMGALKMKIKTAWICGIIHGEFSNNLSETARIMREKKGVYFQDFEEFDQFIK